MLTPHEKLTGTPQQKREIYERLVRFRQHPDCRPRYLASHHSCLNHQAATLTE